MSSLFPFRPEPAVDPDGSRLLSIGEDAADEVFDALGSQTARAILASVYDDPRPASELADATDTSIQNARYHLQKLQDAGLVDVADTWYSERGTEMKVYAPTNEAVVVMAGDEETRTGVLDALKRFLGAVGVVGIGALVVQALLAPDTLVPSMGASGGESGGSGGFSTMDAAQPTSASGGHGVVDALVGLLSQPGVAFFVGGVLVLVALLAWQYVR